MHARLEDDADFWQRGEQTATLLATLRQIADAEDSAELTLGAPRYMLEEPERYRSRVVAEVRSRLLETARDLLDAPPRIRQIEISPRLQVTVLGMVEAVLSLEAKVTIEATTSDPT